jgi:hypothetical protein
VPSVGPRRGRTEAAVAVALCLIVVSLARYTSFSDRRILARWSLVHFGLIVLVLAALAWVVSRWWMQRASTGGPGVAAGWAHLAAALGLLAWSAAFLLDSLEDAAAGGRLLDLRIFSSSIPASIVLEWVAMALGGVTVLLIAARFGPAGATWRARATRNALLASGAIVVTLLLVEGGLRLQSLLAPQIQGFPTRAQALWIRRYVKLNSLGYRDVEHTVEAPDGVTRILLIGDSYAFGSGIDDPRHRVGDLLEEALNRAAAARRFEVIQAARPDTHTLHHIEALRRMLVFRPRYVLLLYVFNDIDHVARPASAAGPTLDALVAPAYPLRLALLNFVTAEQVFIRARRAWFARVWQTLPDPYRYEAVLAEHLRALVRFFELARAAGAEARLVPWDPLVRAAPRFAERYRLLERAAVAHGIAVWSLERAFDGHEWSSLVANHLDNHPNERSHALAARAIVERFEAEFGPAARPRSD